METPHDPINPFFTLLRSPVVRQHLCAASHELALALRAGLSELRAHITQSELPQQFPYLLSALSTLHLALNQWAMGHTKPARKRRAGAKPKRKAPHGSQ